MHNHCTTNACTTGLIPLDVRQSACSHKQFGAPRACRPDQRVVRRMSTPKRRLFQERKELVQRYVRLAVYRKTKNRSKAIARRIVRLRLLWTERERKRLLDATLKTVAFETARARKNGFETVSHVMNLGLFFLIAERDIQAVKVDALTHPDPWRRSLAARVMLLTIHELDIDKAAGSKLRQSFQDGRVPEELQSAVTEAMRTIRKAQTRAQRQFAELRNSTIAHRDADAVRQYRDIVEIDGLEVTNIAAEFYEGTHLFSAVLPKLILHLGTWSSLAAQLTAKSNRKAL